MRIHVLEGGWDYEGSETLGIFTDRKRAVRAYDKERPGTFDVVSLYTWDTEAQRLVNSRQKRR